MTLPTAVNLYPALSHLPILLPPRPSYTQPQEWVSKGAGEGSKVKKSLPFDHQIVWTFEWKFKALPSTMLISFQTCLPFPDINPLLYWNWTTHHSPNPCLCCLHVIRTLNPSPQKSRVQETVAGIQVCDDDTRARRGAWECRGRQKRRE